MVGFLVFILFIIFIISIIRKPKEDYHSNWSTLLPNFKFSTKEFYKLVRSEMESHEISDLSFKEVSLKTGSIFSSERLYLRVRWNEYYYDLCFAPFGDGCFVSWWLIFETSEGEEIFSKTPLIGEWIRRTFYRKTFYKIDTASMFMTYAHNAVLSVIDEITKSSGIRISQEDRKPILKNLFQR